MSEEKLQLFDKAIPNGVCVEFGSGGSSSFFFLYDITALYSVESDGQWLAELCKNPMLKEKAAANKFHPIHADIGQVTQWGCPVGHPSPAWRNYHQGIWDKIPAADVDVILIDGRFRVACALQAFLRCRDEVVYVIHDFTVRPEYGVLLRYVEVVETSIIREVYVFMCFSMQKIPVG